VPAITFITIPLELEHQIKNLESKLSQKWLENIKKWPTRPNLVIQKHVEDVTIVGTFLLYPEVQHSVLLTLVGHNERELQPQ
jgi:hypothetical protein